MKYYLGEVRQTLVPKNKLEKAIQTQLKDVFERKLIKESDLQGYMNEIKRNIEGLKHVYPNCKPIKVYWWTPALYADKAKDYVLGGVDCIRFVFVCSKEGKL